MQNIQRKYDGYITSFSTVYDAIQQGISVDNQLIRDIVAEILNDLDGVEAELKQFMLFGQNTCSGHLQNPVNVAIVSALLARGLDYTPEACRDLVAGALLHDIGMLRIPAEIIEKKSSLSDEELRLIQTYPVHSYRIITGELAFHDEVGVVALQHQERWSGGGYPRNLSGDAIHINARIVAVADAFDAMLSKRPYRSSMDGYNAVRTILRDNGQRFDPKIIKVFIRRFGIYPRGCIVLLNNASIGRVVDLHPESPLRPRIKIMIDNEGADFADDDGPEIDLRDEKRLFIAKAINQEQLQNQEEHPT